jgi:hypothetical protein
MKRAALAPEILVVASKPSHDGSLVAAPQRPTWRPGVAHLGMLHCQIDAGGCTLAVNFNLVLVAGRASGIVPGRRPQRG